MTFVRRSVANIDIYDPMNYADRQFDGYVCLETGEIISEEEYDEWKQSMFLSFSPIVDNFSPESQHTNNLLDSFLHVEQALASLCQMMASGAPLIPDVNPDQLIGDSCTDILNIGNVEHRIFPIFSELPAKFENPLIVEVFHWLSWLVETFRIRIFRGEQISKCSCERISSYLSAFLTDIEPLKDPPVRKHELVSLRARADDATLKFMQSVTRAQTLQKRLKKRTRLLRHARKLLKTLSRKGHGADS